MRLSILEIREVESGEKTVEDLTKNQQKEYKQYLIDKKLVENNISEQIVSRLKEVGKFDVEEIGKVLEKYSDDEEEFWNMYRSLDFKWLNRQLQK